MKALLLAVVTDPAVLNGSAVVGSAVLVWMGKKLLSIERRLTRIETKVGVGLNESPKDEE